MKSFFWRIVYLSLFGVCLSLLGVNNEDAMILKFLKKIESPLYKSGLENVDCIYIINLDERPEKWNRVKSAFDSQDLNINRVSAINGWKMSQWQKLRLFGNHTVNLSGGEIGCLLTHLSIYKDALERDLDIVWICEDDVEFIEGVDQITQLIENVSLIDPDWDLVYTDCTTHGLDAQNPRPGQALYNPEFNVVNRDVVKIHGRHCLHSVIFSNKGLRKIFDYFTHTSLWSAIDVDIHYVPNLREYSSTRNIVTAVKVGIISDTPIGSALNRN